MTRVKNENYVNVAGWMVNDLKLKGNELIVYAIIYGFSQAEDQTFSGSLQYLADWTNSTKQGVIKSLKSLVEKGYIGKKDNVINGVKFCEYYATKFNGVLNKVEQGMQQSLIGGVQQSSPNIIGFDTKGENKEDKRVAYDSVIDSYTDNEELKRTISEFTKMRKLIKKPMTDKALSLMLHKLDKIGGNDSEKIQILNNSISGSWQGIYPLKDNSQKVGANGVKLSDQRDNSLDAIF